MSEELKLYFIAGVQTVKNDNIKNDISNYVKYLEDKIERICSATGINPELIK
jgi:hypothetical protein